MNKINDGEMNKVEQAICNALLSELKLNGKQLTEIQEDAIANIMRLDVYGDETDLCNYSAEELYKKVKRIEPCDVPWLKLWKRYYENEQDESVKFSLLKWGVCSLVQEDLRAYISAQGAFTNSRPTFSEIHEDYSRVLGVSVEDVSSTIDTLIRGCFLRKLESWLGVVYVPIRMYGRLDMEYEYGAAVV